MFIGGFQDIADDASLSHREKVQKVHAIKARTYARVLTQGNYPANSVAPLVGSTFSVGDVDVTLHYAAVREINGCELLHVVLTTMQDGQVIVPPTEDIYLASPPMADTWSDEEVMDAAKTILARVRLN